MVKKVDKFVFLAKNHRNRLWRTGLISRLQWWMWWNPIGREKPDAQKVFCHNHSSAAVFSQGGTCGMRIKLQRDIDKLKARVIALGTLVEERFRMAVRALESRDAELARRIFDSDIDIDQMEVELEEEGLKILALHQPVADQLRYIVAVLKMNNDLERIGDLAVNVAGRAEWISGQNGVRMPFDYSPMCQRVQNMLDKSLDSLVNMDVELAYEVCAEDDEVDTLKKAVQAQFADEIRRGHPDIEALTSQFLISRHLERIADHATNIAEDVIYMITGRIHRHRVRRLNA